MSEVEGARAAVKQAIWQRDGGRCGYCGKPVAVEEMELDHILPASLGGPTTYENLRASHRVCNRAAGNRAVTRKLPITGDDPQGQWAGRVLQGHPVQFRGGPVLRELEARQVTIRERRVSPGVVAARDLVRYYGLIEQELRRVRLSEAEAVAVCDAVLGLDLSPPTILVLWATVEQAIRSGLALPANVNREALVQKLRNLSLGAQFALADAAERANGDIQTGLSPESAVLRAGMVVI